MRARLIDRGGDGLADYEVLEMLLFLGIPRGDTKPLAKALINRFGGLAGVLGASPSRLLEAGVPRLRAMLPLRLAIETAERLARAEHRARPVLASLGAVAAYLDRTATNGTRLFHLDNRNRLLADEAWDGGAPVRVPLRRALEHHATALILVDRGGADDRPAFAAAREAIALAQAGTLLSVTLHDRILVTPAGPLSYRAAGLLR